MTQHDLADDPADLATTAPRAWSYLCRHARAFAERRSTIYQKRPPFSMFGIGDYSFAPYKVAISGLHKEPKFRAIGPVLGRPVMLDDTCYFVPAGSATEASLLSAFLNHEKTRCFIDAIAFWDAKRPITKRLLQRIDIASLLDVISADEIGPIADATLSGLQPAASVSDWTQVAREALAGPDPQLKLAL